MKYLMYRSEKKDYGKQGNFEHAFLGHLLGVMQSPIVESFKFTTDLLS